MPSPATVVMVHGAWHGPWCWDRVVAGLEARGAPTLCIDRRRGDPLRGADDGDENERMTRDQMADVSGPIVMIGHSFGGNAITVAPLGDDRVKHLVYLTAMMPDRDGAVPPELVREELAQVVVPADDGSSTVREDALRNTFYHQCSDEDYQLALDNLVPDDMHGINRFIPRDVAYEQIPTTYVVCTEDRCLSPEGQRIQARRAGTVVEWATDHSPFFSAPHLVVDLLDRLAVECGE